MVGVNKAAKKRMVAVNERGHVVGQDHPRAVLTDHDVDLVFALREDGLSLGRIAKAMEVSKGCIAHILAGRTRAHVVVTWRRVSLPAKT